jgi:hypothetical protein
MLEVENVVFTADSTPLGTGWKEKDAGLGCRLREPAR